MGGQGVSAYCCAQHIEEASALVKHLVDTTDAVSDPNLRPAVMQAFEQLSEARLAATEAAGEIQRLSHDYELLSIMRVPPRSSIQAPQSPDETQEKHQAEQLMSLALLASADKGFRSLDSFVGWFVGGTGAAVGLILANLNDLKPYMGAVDLSAVILRVVFAFVAVVIARFLGSIICTVAGAAEKVFDVMDSWQRRGWPLPSSEALQSAREEAMPLLLRLYPRRIRNPSAIELSRRSLGALMTAGLLSIVASALIGWALFDVAMGLTVPTGTSTAATIKR